MSNRAGKGTRPHPAQCWRCGKKLSGVDAQPYRHPVVELPRIEPYGEEHRLHERTCAACGTATRDYDRGM